jgi:hypothetical protein
MEPVSSQQIWVTGKWHQRAHQKPHRQHEVPADPRKDITYGQFVCLVRPQKAEPNQMQFTVGNNRINYPGEVATPTAEMLVAKMLFNSVLSTKGA